MVDGQRPGRLPAWHLLRIGTAVNFLLHGAVRVFGDWAGFAEQVGDSFESTWVPVSLATLIAWLIPPIELLAGAWLLTGWRAQQALLFLGGLMILLLSGTCLQQEWSTVGTQMVYLLILSVLLRETPAPAVDSPEAQSSTSG